MAFTDRHGGVSGDPYSSRNLGGLVGDAPESVAENRARTAGELGLGPGRLVFLRQVHSADVAYVTEPYGDDAPPLDGAVTDLAGLGIAVLGADCAAVLVADPVGGVIGAAHSGRPGTLAGVVTSLAEEMSRRGADLSRATAVVGPAACGRCYEVPAGMREEAARVRPETWSTTSWGTPALDLRAGIVAQLGEAGVTDIRHDARCTIESPELFSHRREHKTGRFAGIVWMPGG
ncbi:peptidoglycan editing factor PgeF [Spongiactinospora sp. TRM90649]|uniref:peptidoglycan editing factor PgeF n=1 Tax=Spongiactinospora sp. TRM90649 TaxID=3031114 RepID=UPI0023F83AB6|nr:peptidoglycan editing factor PgeF [Spongiactinospora sp. TRM90649]MDF5752214.1 peptidoglycan editing factor PgeF [Spongiactinospora sp. TRM90649]